MTEAIVIAIISSGVLSTLVSCLFNYFSKKKSLDDGVRAGVRTLLYDRIKTRGNRYISEGQIDSEELQDLINMHKIYHTDLGGNGYLDTLMEKVRSLPVIVKHSK